MTADAVVGGRPGELPEGSWQGDDHLSLEGAEFHLAPAVIDRAALPPGALLLRKPRWMVECYAALRAQVDAQRIFELGIYEGGSTALLALLFRPEKLVAVDLRREPVALLAEFLRDRGLQDSVRPYFEVDQGDRARLASILDDEFGDDPLDLVIDDASHRLGPTTASFNLLFPRLRPGGVFVMEDWSWQHNVERSLATRAEMSDRARDAIAARMVDGDAAKPDVPMSRLVLQVALTTAYDERIVAEVGSLRRGWTTIRRGEAHLDPDTFDIGGCYGSLGRALLADG